MSIYDSLVCSNKHFSCLLLVLSAFIIYVLLVAREEKGELEKTSSATGHEGGGGGRVPGCLGCELVSGATNQN